MSESESWKKEQEIIIKKWADKSLCYKIMHERAYKKYWCLNAWFNIPVIIISTITGTGNFASSNFDDKAQDIIFIIGAFNIFAGILATIATYTGVAQKLESHRFASISWDKYNRKLQIELSKSRKDRMNVKDFIKQVSEEYDRLIEISPILSNDIIRWFTKMIKTGIIEDGKSGLTQCCFDYICFPCGCSMSSHNADIKSIETIDFELPDIISLIKPTIINDKPDDIDIDTITIQKTDSNIYNIYETC